MMLTPRTYPEKGGSLAQTGTLYHVKRNEVSPVIPRLSQPPEVLLIMAYTIRGGFTRKGCLLAAKTTFCLCIVKRLIVTLRCAVNVTTSSYQHFPWRLSAKLVFREAVIHNFKNQKFWSHDQLQLTHIMKMVRVGNTKSLLFCLRYYPLIVFRRQNSFHFHKNDVTWPLREHS